MPSSIPDVVDFFGWLLHSGVNVILDEFQRMRKYASKFQDLVDLRGNFTAHFVILGSHVSYMEGLISGANAPLFIRGFDKMYFYPWSPIALNTVLMQLGLSGLSRVMVGLYNY